MSFNTKVLCQMHELMETVEDPIVKAQLNNFWKNLCHHKRATEAIGVGPLHSIETLKKSRNELRNLENADSLYKSIINE